MRNSKITKNKKHVHAEENGAARIHQDGGLVSGQHPAEEVYPQIRKKLLATSQQTGGDGYSASGDVRPKLQIRLTSKMLKLSHSYHQAFRTAAIGKKIRGMAIGPSMSKVIQEGGACQVLRLTETENARVGVVDQTKVELLSKICSDQYLWRPDYRAQRGDEVDPKIVIPCI